MQCIVVKSDEFENSSPLYIFPLNPDYVAARFLRSLRSNNTLVYSMNIKANNSISQANGHVLTPVLAWIKKKTQAHTVNSFHNIFANVNI